MIQSTLTDALLRESAGRKGSTHAPVTPTGRDDDDRMYVQSRRPLDPNAVFRVKCDATHDNQQRGYYASWWMARLERR